MEISGGRGGGGPGASAAGGVLERAAVLSDAEATGAETTPVRKIAATPETRVGPNPRRRPGAAVIPRPATRRLCARFPHALSIIGDGNYTAQGGPGPREGRGGVGHAFPGTARASAIEVDVRRAGSSGPQRRCGELRGKVSSTWSTSGRRAVPGISLSHPHVLRISLVAPTGVALLYPRCRALSRRKYNLW